MSDHLTFANGVYSVLKVDWTLRLETPLCIRNGERLNFDDLGPPKSRNRKLRMSWVGDTGAHDVSSAAFGYKIVDGKLVSEHIVPPTGLRGALRAWTVRHLLPVELHTYLLPKAADAPLRPWPTQPATDALALITSLFGLTTDAEAEVSSSAGRLRVDVEPFVASGLSTVDVAGAEMTIAGGPDNVALQMTVRNPLDRVTQASHKGGLHHFLEFRRGSSFHACLTFFNARPSDLGLISVWQRELEAGLLRLGALASIGRGRLSVQAQSYTLWQRPNAPVFVEVDQFRRLDADPHLDVLAGLWHGYVLPPAALASFEAYL